MRFSYIAFGLIVGSTSFMRCALAVDNEKLFTEDVYSRWIDNISEVKGSTIALRDAHRYAQSLVRQQMHGAKLRLAIRNFIYTNYPAVAAQADLNFIRAALESIARPEILEKQMRRRGPVSMFDTMPVSEFKANSIEEKTLIEAAYRARTFEVIAEPSNVSATKKTYSQFVANAASSGNALFFAVLDFDAAKRGPVATDIANTEKRLTRIILDSATAVQGLEHLKRMPPTNNTSCSGGVLSGRWSENFRKLVKETLGLIPEKHKSREFLQKIVKSSP